MRMIRVRVDDFDFDYLTARAERNGNSLAGFVRDLLHAVVMEGTNGPLPKPVSDLSDTEPVPSPRDPSIPSGRSRTRPVPTAEQWERLNKRLAATGRQPEEGTITTRSGLMAWAVGEGFRP